MGASEVGNKSNLKYFSSHKPVQEGRVRHVAKTEVRFKFRKAFPTFGLAGEIKVGGDGKLQPIFLRLNKPVMGERRGGKYRSGFLADKRRKVRRRFAGGGGYDGRPGNQRACF